MDVYNTSFGVDKYGALPDVAPNVSILLVDHDTTSLRSLASQFEYQLYRVTTAESADVALSLFQAQTNYYDVVIADLHMPKKEIYEFVLKLHRQHNKNIPIILIVENVTMDLVREARGYGVCYLFSKPISRRDIATLWQHVFRVTGEMPFSTDTTYNVEKYGICDGATMNQKQRNSKRRLSNTDIEDTEGRRNQIAEDSNSPNDTEEDRCYFKKSRMTWTSSLHENFSQAINILGEQKAGAQPTTLLRMMNEPGLTRRQISGPLQKYRDRKRHSVNLQKTAGPAMPTVRPAAPMSIFSQGQASNTENLDYMASPRAPQIPRSPSGRKQSNFVGYTIDYVKEILDALSYTRNDNVNAVISNGGFQIPKGSGGVQIAPSIDLNHSTYENPDANINGEQPPVFPQRDVSLIPASSHPILNNGQALQASDYLTNRLEAPNSEPAAATGDIMLSSDDLSNGIQAPNQEPARAGIDVIPATGHSSNGLQALNQELAGDIGIGMGGLGNGSNLANMNNDNFGEGTSANQEFDGKPINDIDERVNQIIQDFEASGFNIWERID